MPEQPDIVIVGAGIAGASMAIVLARTGRSILLLEKSAQFVDRIRGEGIASWGVIEARQIGVLDLLVAAGAVYIRRNLPYGEGVPPDLAQARAIAVDQQVPGSQGNLDIGHPLMCRERMRRLRITAQEFSRIRCEYTDEARERRRIATSRIAANPALAEPFTIPLRGPDAFPEETYGPSVWRRLYE